MIPGGKGALKGVKGGATTIAKGIKRAVEIPSGKIKESKLMEIAEIYLETGYKEVSPGRYLSSDGSRQFRYGAHEVQNLQKHHAHFEYLENGKVVENSRVSVIPN
jgi:hypothetical protein